MRKYYAMLWLFTAASGSMLLQSCKDDDYDLSDIDTTVKAEVKDLTLPINIDPIELGGLVDLDPGSSLKAINGEYVFLQEGEIEASSPIVVPGFTAASPSVPDINVSLSANSGRAAGLSFEIGKHLTSFSYRYSGISSYIHEITSAGTSFNINFAINITGSANAFKSINLNNLKLQLPAGLSGKPDNGCTYDSSTGIVSLPATVRPTEKNGTHSYSFNMDVTAIDLVKAGARFSNQEFTFNNSIGIAGGSVEITELNAGVTATSASLNVKINMSPIQVKTVSGVVGYAIENFSMDPIAIEELPDVLTDSEINLVLTNPQIYLQINNPLAAYKMHAQTGIAITQYRNNEQGAVCAFPGLMELFTATDKTPAEGIYQYCLSPKQPAEYYNEFAQANFRAYPSLGHVLAGDGLPTALAVDFNAPQLPEQQVTDFALDHTFPGISGKYALYAPLAFGAESEISYSEVSDGWFDSDIANLTVTKLEVTATVSSNLPIQVSLSGTPIDKNGNEVTNVQIEGPTIEAGAKNLPIVIRITGAITNLDGIKYTARVKGSEATEDMAIGPELSLTLDKIRASVSGYYTDEL